LINLVQLLQLQMQVCSEGDGEKGLPKLQ